MAKEIIVFYEDSIEIFRGQSLLSKLNLPLKNSLRSKENIEYLKQFIKETGLKIKNANVVFSMDGLITRTIDVPKIKKREIDKYINNNIDEYFTVNANEYYFAYNVSKTTKNNMSIFLVAIPRFKVVDIVSMLSDVNIRVKSFNVYPDIISTYFKNKTGGYGIIDIHDKRTFVTIIDDGDVFLHSSIINDFEDDETVQEYIDNINYFINFYATRHFGKRLDGISIVGEIPQKIKFMIDNQIDIQKEYGQIGRVKGINNILAYQYQKNKINKYNNVDFIKAFNKKDYFKRGLSIAILSILIITVLWTEISLYIINKSSTQLDRKIAKLEQQYNEYKNVEKNISQLEAKKKELETKKNILNQIESEKLDVVDILIKIKNNLPKNIRISEITIDKENVNVTFISIDGKTLDAAKLVVGLNKIGIFEPIDLEKIEMDDNVSDIKLVLKLKNSKG